MNTLESARRNNGFRCGCGLPLTFEPAVGNVKVCHCERCQRRSERGDADSGNVIYVRGHGVDDQGAYNDWLRSYDGF